MIMEKDLSLHVIDVIFIIFQTRRKILFDFILLIL